MEAQPLLVLGVQPLARYVPAPLGGILLGGSVSLCFLLFLGYRCIFCGTEKRSRLFKQNDACVADVSRLLFGIGREKVKANLKHHRCAMFVRTKLSPIQWNSGRNDRRFNRGDLRACHSYGVAQLSNAGFVTNISSLRD